MEDILLDDLIEQLGEMRAKYGNLPVRALQDDHTTTVEGIFRSKTESLDQNFINYPGFADEAILIAVHPSYESNRHLWEHQTIPGPKSPWEMD